MRASPENGIRVFTPKFETNDHCTQFGSKYPIKEPMVIAGSGFRRAWRMRHSSSSLNYLA
jgi:hypothetical protein